MNNIALIGGGITGLANALFLSRRGHRVNLFEAEQRTAGDHIEDDFFRWHRARTPQAIQPHGYLSPVRTVLREEAPDVYADMLALGATEEHEFDWFGEHPPYRPGDEQLMRVRARRIVLEAALQRAVNREKNVTQHHGVPVRNLLIDTGPEVPRIRGVRTDSGDHRADLVVDASGRRSRIPQWLTQAGCRPPVVESHPTDLTYFCRWYRLHPGGPSEPGRAPYASAAPYAVSIVLPSDNRVVSVAIVLSTHDRTRLALRDPDVFDTIASRFPSSGAWLDLNPEPVGGVHVMAGLDNRWTALVDENGPIATGVVGVGDAAIHTNPTLSQGVALGMLTAQRLSRTAGGSDADEQFLLAHHAWATATLKPWFDHQTASDRAYEARLDPYRTAAPQSPGAPAMAALLPATLDDPVIMRAWARARHLIALPTQAYGDSEVQEHLEQWLSSHPDFEPGNQGPSREEWEKLTAEEG